MMCRKLLSHMLQGLESQAVYDYVATHNVSIDIRLQFNLWLILMKLNAFLIYLPMIRVAERLRRAIDRDAPFSGDMYFHMRGQRSAAHSWIQDLLEA